MRRRDDASQTGSRRDGEIRRVQRPLDDLPVVHLEASVPMVPAERWTLTLDGHVERPQVLALAEVIVLESFAANWNFHCVWGWSRPLCRWSGVSGQAVAAAAGISSPYVVVSAFGGTYASALTTDEFVRGLFATHLDDRPLTPEHGAPLRYVPPPGKWQYKGVKWVARVTATTEFTPGFWETAVGDPRGDIPPDREDLRHEI
ncbi:MAG: molybdopterin-dependent oxidoreductase [Actinobacteria bacterium]|nr:molybdopterin-dependent oxidoreductase [Actinomycetota bacterium]